MSRKRKQPIQHVQRDDYPLLMARSLVRASVEVRKPQDLPAGLSDEPELVRPEEVEAMTAQARSNERRRTEWEMSRQLQQIELAIVRLDDLRHLTDHEVKQLQHLRRAWRRLHAGTG